MIVARAKSVLVFSGLRCCLLLMAYNKVIYSAVQSAMAMHRRFVCIAEEWRMCARQSIWTVTAAAGIITTLWTFDLRTE